MENKVTLVPCDNPRYDQKIGYNKSSDTYELYDDYGGCTISVREMRKLLKCVKQTSPDLIMEMLLTSRKQSTRNNNIRIMQCSNCIRKRHRDCMYHGYPEDTIPVSCAYKIGDAAVDTVYDVPTMIRRDSNARK